MSSKVSNKVCYYCGQPKTSKEHIPPKVFLKGISCDRITVPSCDVHNLHKAKIDQAVFVTLTHLLDVVKRSEFLSPELQLSLMHGKNMLPDVNNLMYMSPFLESGSASPVKNLPYLQADLKAWIRHVIAGLVYDATQKAKLPRDTYINWDTIIVLSPHWIELPPNIELTDEEALQILGDNAEWLAGAEQFPWQMGWSSHPRPYPKSIFHFRVCIQGGSVGFDLNFHSGFRAFSAIDPQPSTVAAIQRKLTP